MGKVNIKSNILPTTGNLFYGVRKTIHPKSFQLHHGNTMTMWCQTIDTYITKILRYQNAEINMTLTPL